MKLKTERRYEFVTRVVDSKGEALTAKQVKSMISPNSWKAPLAVVQATLNNAVQRGLLAKSKIDGVKYIHYHPVGLDIPHGTLVTEKHTKNIENKTTRVTIETNDIDDDGYTDEDLASMPYSVVLNKAKAEYNRRKDFDAIANPKDGLVRIASIWFDVSEEEVVEAIIKHIKQLRVDEEIINVKRLLREVFE